MKILLEVICFPITLIMWLTSFLFVVVFSFDMFKKAEQGEKNFWDILVDIDYIIHRTYLYDFYSNTNLYIRTIISITIYYNIFN